MRHGRKHRAAARVSPTEILAQLPFGLTGDVPLVVRNRGVSNPFTAHPDVCSGDLQAARPATRRDCHVIRQKNGDFVNFTNPFIRTIFFRLLTASARLLRLHRSATEPPRIRWRSPRLNPSSPPGIRVWGSVLRSGAGREVSVYVINVLCPTASRMLRKRR